MEFAVITTISALMFIATEFFFPIQADNAIAKQQRHFWAIILSILTIVLGLVINNTFRTFEHIEEVGAVFTDLSDPKLESSFVDILKHYHSESVQDSAPLGV